MTSHAVGVMVLQASAASALRERDPAAARDALKTVDETAAQTLRELEMMFQLLDSGAIGGPGLAGATLEPLQSLVDRMRKTGLDISLEQTAIPPHLSDVVYRIVQESLTNVVRHSNARHVRITVGREQSNLTYGWSTTARSAESTRPRRRTRRASGSRVSANVWTMRVGPSAPDGVNTDSLSKPSYRSNRW